MGARLKIAHAREVLCPGRTGERPGLTEAGIPTGEALEVLLQSRYGGTEIDFLGTPRCGVMYLVGFGPECGPTCPRRWWTRRRTGTVVQETP